MGGERTATSLADDSLVRSNRDFCRTAEGALHDDDEGSGCASCGGELRESADGGGRSAGASFGSEQKV